MSKTNWLMSSILSAVVGIGANQAALACAFHGYTPDPTLVDVLLGTEQVVVARLAPSSRTRLEPVDTLLGVEVSDIPVTVGPDTLVRLRGDPQASVLLARDGAYGPWLEITVLDPRFRSVIDRVIQRQSAWASGAEKDRLAVFARLVNDPNPDLRRLALRELDRAPYSDLKEADVPEVRTLAQDLQRGEADLMPIRVLLAGLSGDRGFSPWLRDGLAQGTRTDIPYLGAYATALIELEGQAAVTDILDTYLRPETLSWGAQEKLLQALALQHQSADPRTRRAITHGIAELARQSPNLREAAARQFGTRTGWRSGGTPSRANTGESAVSDR